MVLRIVEQRPSLSRDAYVARAIAAMRAEPARSWTVAELARRAGLSRAAFARRFKEATGVPPLRWLALLRLRLAAEQLVATDLGLAEIADGVGYRCAFAFAKAFKRLFGVAPGRYRRRTAPTSTFVVRAAA